MQLIVNGYNVIMYVLLILGRCSFSQWVFVFLLGHGFSPWDFRFAMGVYIYIYIGISEQ